MASGKRPLYSYPPVCSNFRYGLWSRQNDTLSVCIQIESGFTSEITFSEISKGLPFSWYVAALCSTSGIFTEEAGGATKCPNGYPFQSVEASNLASEEYPLRPK